MDSVAVTFEDLERFILEQERIILKSIKNDESLRKLLKTNKIKLSNTELESILIELNKQIKKRYRIRLFLRQSRFQVIQQITQVERENKKAKIDKIENINSIMLSIFDQKIENLEKFDEISKSIIFADDNLNLIQELPDSNLLETNDVELIEEYDIIREKLIKNVQKMKKINENIKQITNLTDNINNTRKIFKDKDEDNNELQDKINKEIDKMRYLLALVESKEEI
jgi:hypothetical protein